jgi:ribosomal protein S18 acetylase RimI-like enzyme
MPRLEIRAFSDEHLDGAAELLAARHRRQRVAESLLPRRFEDPRVAREALEALWRQDATSGCTCFRDARLIGYLIGSRRDPAEWGDNVWVDYAGHAVEEPEDVRDLYAAAAARWVDEGRRHHFAQVPAHDRALLDAWFRLGFGQQQADGVVDVPESVEVRVPAGVEVRGPTVDDVEALIPVDLALPRHHRASPVFSTRPLTAEDELRAEWAKTLAGGEETVFIGCRGDHPVACWALVDGKPYMPALIAPERTCYLKFAATVPEARGSGIGVALTDTSLAWAAEQGYRAMGTDWRVTNLLASRFWPRRGFRTTFRRLYRHIP